jgi:penicillin-binding protein 1A
MTAAANAPRTRRERHSVLWRYRRVLFAFGLLVFTGLAGAAYAMVRIPLPPAKVQAQTTFLEDANGTQLAELDAGVNRENVTLDQVPAVLQDAVLATEDRSFYDHGGIDPIGIIRATVADVRRKGSLQGGSTITQQYVKNVYLESERKLSRKIKEAALAVKIERTMPKEEILERYLNTVYFGRGAYGVQAAAGAYFGKDVKELGLRESAYLAGLIRSPIGADALKENERPVAEARRSRTLRNMLDAGKISRAQADEVEAQPLASYIVSREQGQPTFAMADKGTQYFVEAVLRELRAELGLDDGQIFANGFRIKTTLDLKMQADAYDAVYGFLGPDEPAGALVSIDDQGGIKAMVGGRDWSTSKVNLAVGKAGGGSGRQPGSTFKPFVLAEVVREGYNVTSTLPGPAKVIFPKANQGKDYPVENYESAEFGDAVNLVDATANSVNTVYAQMIDIVGATKVAQTAHDMGIESNLVPGLSLALGTSEVSVLEMASAYTTLANRGERVKPTTILEVRNPDGSYLKRPESQQRDRVLERRQADIVTYALQQVVKRGSGTGAQFGKPLAGKTGTTQDFGDAWFVGYTPKLTTAVWMGYAEGNQRKMLNVRGRKVNGGSFPAQIFKRFMTAATKGIDTGSFPAPPSLTGKTLPPSKKVVLPTTTTSSTTTTIPDPNATTTTAPPASTTTTKPPPSSTTSSTPPTTSKPTSTTAPPPSSTTTTSPLGPP